MYYRDHLETIENHFRKKFFEYRLDHHKSNLDRYIQEIESGVTSDLRFGYKRYLKIGSNKLAEGYEQKLHDLIQWETDTTISSWREKLEHKLGFLANHQISLDMKGYVQGAICGDILCKGPNFSFVVRTQIVLHASNKGKLFNRYPLTFHDVTLNGEKIKSPSHSKILAFFGKE